MRSDILKFFTLQRQIFGICPKCNDLFRLSDTKIYLKEKPVKDWMDKLDSEEERVYYLEGKIKEEKLELQKKAQVKGRRAALVKVKKIDPVFTPRNLNPDDAKVILHPIDYIVFNGMKKKPMKNIILLDRKMKGADYRWIQKSIERVIEKENYEWQTLRVQEDGNIRNE